MEVDKETKPTLVVCQEGTATQLAPWENKRTGDSHSMNASLETGPSISISPSLGPRLSDRRFVKYALVSINRIDTLFLVCAYDVMSKSDEVLEKNRHESNREKENA